MTYYHLVGEEPSIAAYPDTPEGQADYDRDMAEFEARQQDVNQAS